MEKDEEWGFEGLKEVLKKYQDPKEFDRMGMLEVSLEGVKEGVKRNLEEIKLRGKGVEELLKVSEDVDEKSKKFLATAKTLNKGCCSLI